MKYLIKANRCKVKTWREQPFRGQRGAKRGPGGAPAREQMPFGDARPPAEAASLSAASLSAALPARARRPGAFASLYGVMMAPPLPCLPPPPPSLCLPSLHPASRWPGRSRVTAPGDAHSRRSDCGMVFKDKTVFLGSWLGGLSKAPLGWQDGGGGSVPGFQPLILWRGAFDTWPCSASLEQGYPDFVARWVWQKEKFSSFWRASQGCSFGQATP